jgi:hypothetical protein
MMIPKRIKLNHCLARAYIEHTFQMRNVIKYFTDYYENKSVPFSSQLWLKEIIYLMSKMSTYLPVQIMHL